MKHFKRIISFLFIGVLLLSLLPAAAAAVDNENVLISIAHIDAGTSTLAGNNRAIYLAFPHHYAADYSLDLTNGLDPHYDTSKYKSVVLTPSTPFALEGETVTLTVTYNSVTDNVGASQGKTDYVVHVSRAAKVDPTFSGNILMEFSPTDAKTQSISYTELSANYNKNDGEDFGSLAIFGANPSFGAIKIDGHDYTFGDVIDPTSNIEFIATNAGSVSYSVKAYTTDDSIHPIGNKVLTITFLAPPQIKNPITKTLSKGSSYFLSAKEISDNCNLFGVPIDSVKITPTASTYGTWYNGTKPFSAATVIQASDLPSLSFVGNTSGTAAFSWIVTTKAGSSDTGVGTITVTSPTMVLAPYTDLIHRFRGSTWYISSSHFGYAPLTADLSYIKISTIPAATDGSLCLSAALPKNDVYGYPAIAANTALKTGAIIPASYLNYLYLATKSTSTKEFVAFTWTATADAKISTAFWGEPVAYTVSFISGGVLPIYAPHYYSTDMNIPLTLPSGEIISNFQSLTNNPLSYVTFTVPDKSFGTLFLNYDITKKTGTAISASNKYYAAKTPNLSNITFVPTKDYTGTSDISYSAFTESGAYITGKIRILVQNSPGGTVSYITDKNSPIQFDAKDFQAAFLSATGKPLSRVYFSPPIAAHGLLCYNYNLTGDYDAAVSSSYAYSVYTSNYLSLVSFVPYNNYTGPVTIYYTGYIENSAIPYSGKLIIYIVDSPAGNIRYSVKQNANVTLSASDFSEEFIRVTGSLLSYVTFTLPAATTGSLYYQYDADTQTGTKVTSATKYYDGKSPDISDITFVPAKDLVGTCVVPYTGYTTSGTSYAGKLKFTVYEGSGVISYTAASGNPLSMDSADFANAFYMNSGGKSLSYITFEIPSSSYGKFYYDYTSATQFDSVVSNDKKYYATTTPFISNVSFVPQESYTGSFSVTYTGYTSSGAGYTGKIKFSVSGANSGSVKYETTSLAAVAFNASDFSTAFTGKSSYPLSYVKFTLPYDSYGKLYYGNTLVSPESYYYLSSLSSITFVPNTNYSGVLAISYKAFDTYGYSYNGTVLITVKSSDIGTITYNTNLNKPILFNSDDFNTAFLNKTGSALYSVAFTLPASSSGTLYLGYKSSTSYTAAVSAGSKYFRSFSPLLSDITFVPSSGYYGTVTVLYTAYTLSGSAYYGKIIINVGTSVPFTDIDANYPWAKDAISYLYRSGIITDSGSGKYYPGNNMTRGDFVMMIASAFNLTNASYDNFPDVSLGSPYYDAISAAKAVGIIYGSSDGKFYPDSGLTRQDAMVIIVRALEYVGAPISEGSADDLTGYSDASQVSDYAVSAVATLVRTGLVNGSDGKLIPKSLISRAETAVILYRILTM